jgi:P27 family predicted phage terminase small subunit
MGKGRKAIPPELKDKSTYKNVSVIEGQKEYSIKANSKLTPPRELTDGAKKEWKRVVKLYKDLEVEVLNDLDVQVLSSYCIEVDIRDKLYKKWREQEAEDIYKTNKTTRASISGNDGKATRDSRSSTTKTEVNPLLREISFHNKLIRVLAEQLALTPASRASYSVRQEKKNRSAAEEFMGDE